MDCDLIIKGKYVLPMDDELSIIRDGYVAVKVGKILAVGQARENQYQAKEIIDAGDSIVMPGLINCHTHAAMTYFRGLADDLPLEVWLNQHIWPAEAKYVNEDFVKRAGELACLEMLKAGVTCYNDMYFFGSAMAEPAIKAGIRALVGIVGLDFKEADQAIKDTMALASEFKNHELVKIVLAPHAVYSCSEETLLKIKQAAEKENLRLHMHVSETKNEVEDARKAFGKTPAAYLDSLGLLSDKFTAAHSVWLTDQDLEIYKNRGVKVAHCPISNMKLASGAAPLKRMLEMGITVGLGTDGAASNNTLDLFSDMRACALMHKVNNFDPTAVRAKQVVKMATIDGARALGLEKETGSLETGKMADIITINLNQPHLTPLYDPYSHLVYCVGGQDVKNVIVNGKMLMRNREVKTLDEKKILRQAGEFNI